MKEIVEHYRLRIEDFDKDRQEILDRLDACTAPRKQLHELEWELRKRSGEIRELQQALASSQTFIYEERERLLALQAENEDLRLQQAEDRARTDCLAATLEASKAGGVLPKEALRAACGPESVNELKLRLASCQNQLAEQKQFAVERIQALMDVRRSQEVDAAACHAMMMHKQEELMLRLHTAEEALQHSARDCILTRRAKDGAEMRAVTAEAELKHLRLHSCKELQEAREGLLERLEQAQATAEQRVEEHTEGYRLQVIAREREIAAMEASHKAAMSLLEEQLLNAESRLARESEQCRHLEHRRLLDIEGWASDMTLLRQQMAATNRKLHQMRLASRLPDDERLDDLMEHLERKHPDVLTTADLQALGVARTHNPMAVVAAELDKTRCGISNLERRLKSICCGPARS